MKKCKYFQVHVILRAIGGGTERYHAGLANEKGDPVMFWLKGIPIVFW